MTNSENLNIHTRQSNNLHLPLPNFTVYRKGFQYSGIKFVNKIPLKIKIITGSPSKFKGSLRKILNTRSFCILEEFYNT